MCTWFLNNRVWKIKFNELDFLSSLNLDFTGYTGSKNPIWIGPKIQFIELDFSNLIFQKYTQPILHALPDFQTLQQPCPKRTIVFCQKDTWSKKFIKKIRQKIRHQVTPS